MLSIIIVTYRAWPLLEANLHALFQSAGIQPPEAPPWEIIVVDNDADHDSEAAYALKSTFTHVRVLQAYGDYGYAYGCNCGAQAAHGDLLLFMGSDLKAEASQIDQLIQGLEDYPEYAAITAPQKDLNGRLQRSFAPFTRLSNYFSSLRWIQRRLSPRRHTDPRTPPEALPEMLPVDWISGSLVLVRKSALANIGGWDEKYWLYCEDEDLCRRMQYRGLKVGYYTPPRFIHAHGVSTRGTLEETALYKSETVISKNIYLNRHELNFNGNCLRFLLRLQTRVALPVYSILSHLTGGGIRRIELGKKIHRRLHRYYKTEQQTGIMTSEYSIQHPDNPAKPIRELKTP